MQGGCRPELGGHAGGLTHLFAGGHGAEGAEAVGVRDHHGRGEARRVGVLWRLLLVRVHCRHTHTQSVDAFLMIHGVKFTEKIQYPINAYMNMASKALTIHM